MYVTIVGAASNDADGVFSDIPKSMGGPGITTSPPRKEMKFEAQRARNAARAALNLAIGTR